MTEIEITFWVLGVVLSGFFSWFFTAHYYKRSLSAQSNEWDKQMTSLTSALRTSAGVEMAQLKNQRIEECLREYKRAGTPVRLIDTYTDLSDGEKADLLDAVLILARGRKAKQNKYRGGT